MRKLYLDDERTPKTDGWVIVRNYHDFVEWITNNGIPDEVSFDHDLSDNKSGREYTGYDCAQWLCQYCWENGLPIPKWNVHSGNPVGRDNIQFILRSFEKRLNK